MNLIMDIEDIIIKIASYMNICTDWLNLMATNKQIRDALFFDFIEKDFTFFIATIEDKNVIYNKLVCYYRTNTKWSMPIFLVMP